MSILVPMRMANERETELEFIDSVFRNPMIHVFRTRIATLDNKDKAGHWVI